MSDDVFPRVSPGVRLACMLKPGLLIIAEVDEDPNRIQWAFVQDVLIKSTGVRVIGNRWPSMDSGEASSVYDFKPEAKVFCIERLASEEPR